MFDVSSVVEPCEKTGKLVNIGLVKSYSDPTDPTYDNMTRPLITAIRRNMPSGEPFWFLSDYAMTMDEAIEIIKTDYHELELSQRA
jgi:hypothetical protein